MALPMFYLSKGYVSLPFFDLYYKYLLGIGIILLAVVHFLFSADLRSAVRSLKDCQKLCDALNSCAAGKLTNGKIIRLLAERKEIWINSSMNG